MLTAAVAAEYNPFHRGHAVQIAKTREAGATHIVAVMSGNFTQRGTAAVAEKRVRAKAALLGGADLVVELPLPYAVATAQRFADGAVSTAEAMGCVDMMSFGCEAGDIALLKRASEAVCSEAITESLKRYLDAGMTFARARQLAVGELFDKKTADVLSSPNNNLALEYLRALRIRNSAIEPFAVMRTGAGHDASAPVGETASASYLRECIREGRDDELAALIPEASLAALMKGFDEGFGPFDAKKAEGAVLGVLRRMRAEEFSSLPDISEGLEHRIYSAVRQAKTLEEVYIIAKSKRYTAARIRRVITSAFLGLDREFCEMPVPYIRVLGANTRGHEILAKMRNTACVPYGTSLAKLASQSAACTGFAECEARATDLYLLGLPEVRPCGLDYTMPCVNII